MSNNKISMGLILISLSVFVIPGTNVFGSSDVEVFVTSGSPPDTHEVEMRVIEGSDPISGFKIRPESVVQVEYGWGITIATEPSDKVDKVKVTSADGTMTTLECFEDNSCSLEGLVPGAYILDIIVNTRNGDRAAYETILIILKSGEPVQPVQVITQIINKIKVVTETTVFNGEDSNNDNGKDDDDRNGRDGRDGRDRGDRGNPYCHLVPEDYKGSCHDIKDYDEITGLYSCRNGDKVDDWKKCPDQGSHPDEQDYCDLYACEDEGESTIFPTPPVEEEPPVNETPIFEEPAPGLEEPTTGGNETPVFTEEPTPTEPITPEGPTPEVTPLPEVTAGNETQ